MSVLCLMAAATAGVWTLRHKAGAHGELSQMGLAVTAALFLAGAALLLADRRIAFWQEACATPIDDAFALPAAPVEQRSFRQEGALLLGLTALAFAIRLPTLSHSLWYDELWTVYFMRSGPIHALTRQGGYNNHVLNSLLGSLCVLAWKASVGPARGLGFPPGWLVRLPAFAFGVAAAPMLYVVVRAALSRSVGLAAALLLALSPAAVDFSGQTRAYSALIFFTIAQAFWLWRALRDRRASAWIGWLVCAVLGTFAHLYFLFVFGVDALALAALAVGHFLNIDDSRGRAMIEQGLLVGVAWAALVFVCYAGVLESLQTTTQDLAGTEPMARAHEVLVPMLQSWGGVPPGGLLPTYYALCCLLALFGLFNLIQNHRAVALYLLLLLILPPVVVEIAHPHFVYIRFFLFELPAFVTVLAAGAAQVASLAAPHRATVRATLLYGLTGAFVLLTVPGLRNVLRLPKQDYRAAAAALRPEVAKGTIVVGTGAGNEFFVDYGLRLPELKSPRDLMDLTRANKRVLVVDTDLMLRPDSPPPVLAQFTQIHAGMPVARFPARLIHWPYHWLDGDSEIKIYELRAESLLPRRS